MNYRRLRNGYYCQRHRGKSHYQIVLEWLSKLTRRSSLSSALLTMSLRGHGLRNDIILTDVVRLPGTCAQKLGRDGILSGRFFVDLVDEEIWLNYKSHFDKKIHTVIEDANRVCRHEFELLGSGLLNLGNPIDWHMDPVSGYCWPKKLFSEVRKARTNADGRDVKLPWELSRMQHLPTLGKAYRLTKDERYADEVVEQICQWLDDNPCPYGINWTCPMDVAIRIMNIIWAYLLIEGASAITNDFGRRIAISVFQHGQYILFNLEFGLRDDGSITNGNHYLTDIVGLLFLGLLCPNFKAAAHWKETGVKALVEEMDQEVLPDGVNFESSISYHRLVLELFTAGALVCGKNDVILPDKFWRRLERMFEFVLCITRPDGKTPQFGDADDGRLFILSDYRNWDRRDFRYLLSIGAVLFNRKDMKEHSGGFSEDAFWLLGPWGMNAFAALDNDETKLASKAFPDAGFYVMRKGDQYLLASCGEVGTNGIGNHKHNDLLSFELYAGDKAFIVDPGSYVYTRHPDWRNLFRSTRYHNTVVIDGQEQNRFEPGQLFKMRPDSAASIREWRSTRDFDRLDGEHTGYARLQRSVCHRRTFLFRKGIGIWEIVDVLIGIGEHTADWYFHFDAGIELTPLECGRFQTRCQGTNLEIVARSDISLTYKLVDGWVSPQYGRKLPAKILHMSGNFSEACRTQLTFKSMY
jgi:Heparinase II/III-like protein/Heparinase II/III N-terminus